MDIKASLLAAGCALSILSLNAIAQDNNSQHMIDCHPWSMTAGLGYTWYNYGYHGGNQADPTAQSSIGDGQTPFGRFAIAANLASYDMFHFGAELGIQNGTTMRLNIAQSTLDILGGAPIQVMILPMLDLLATATVNVDNTPAMVIVKLGVAYRRLLVEDRVTVNDLSQAAGEVQAGLGMSISERASLSLLYQGVFNGNTSFSVNSTNDTGKLNNIPYQNGVLLNLSYIL